jgi:hypothetical protein
MAGMPEMQEHFPAGAWTARYAENEGEFFRWCLDGRHTAKRSLMDMV